MTAEILKLNGLDCMLCLPTSFDASHTYPTIINLHGAGTRGNLTALYDQSIYTEAQNNKDFPFVLISPFCPENTWFDVWEQLMSFVKAVAATPYVDQNRLYLTGASMGGYATWQLAMSMPEYFAAIAPVCGGGMYWNAGRLVNVPVWAFHGAKDRDVYPEESEKMVNAINRRGGNARLTLYPENGHNAWTDTYSNPALYAWFLQHENHNTAQLVDEYKGTVLYG